MERLIPISILLLMLVLHGECLINPTRENEMHDCYIKLLCEMDKVEEFYEVAKLGAPETSQKYVDYISELINVPDPVNTLEYWMKFKQVVCKWPVEEMKKGFSTWIGLVVEHMLEVCMEPAAEICVKAELAADAFSATLTKYEALGYCTEKIGELGDMMSANMDKIASPFG